MLIVDCFGTPYEIGETHGRAARAHIHRCISFYTKVFMENSKRSWPEVKKLAEGFEQRIESSYPHYHEEIRGIAEGSGCGILDIVALNVRTEIAFGLFSDGCTSLSWHGKTRAILGQNWDWRPEQKENLLILRIKRDGDVPSIAMVTEAGIIGKIGLNSRGVGVCLNAILTKGCDQDRLPVHLGLRLALECQSAAEAADRLEAVGMASSAHFLIADEKQAIGFEFTATTFERLPMDANGCVVHANHLLGVHPGIDKKDWLEDSPWRMNTMNEQVADLAQKADEPSLEEFTKPFCNEEKGPSAICRTCSKEGDSETLFNIVLDLNNQEGTVRLGKPVAVEEIVHLTCL
ncbi:peptidase C45 acyl-coenzyme A:6-aminopenicillanic acid acyl-transferas-like protein [Lophiostoma macrostomum CBS 122681]|uniref:Peptidase C45 acyl-coenzyme A:6-aminopenicillanic acid acyl-transferas-like protein n=1 Tax=Lophiostoma macrostomum CBS 122681 TaxID=1314788 RepID=A0A6A6T181_9PLEO|nr:peptidase C45 acyl-coenzyme A:6-aminopenicillanic acid acyl-transferas-like protein [Lophiostoma macrostomum CBS 122681]